MRCSYHSPVASTTNRVDRGFDQFSTLLYLLTNQNIPDPIAKLVIGKSLCTVPA